MPEPTDAPPSPTPPRRHRRIGWILLFAAGVRLVILWQASAHDPTFGRWLPAQDMYAFDAWARAIAEGDWAFDPRPHMPFSPTYPALLAVIYRCIGADMRIVAAVQMGLGLVAVYGVYGIGRALFTERTALLAALGYAVYLPACYYETTLLRAAWVTTAVAVGAWWLLLGVERGARVWLLAVGAALGTATALRVSNVLLVLAAAGAVFQYARAPRGRRAALVGFLLLGTTIAWAPWLVWDSVRPRTVQPGQTAAHVNLIAGNTPDATGVFYHIPPTAERILAEARGDEAVLARSVGAAIAAQPVRWLGVQLRKALVFWHGYEPTNNLSMSISARFVPALRLPVVRYWPVAVVALAGLCVTWRRSPGTRTIAALVLAVYASIAPFLLLSRYRLAVVPLLLPFAAWTLLHGWGALRSRGRWTRASVCAVLGAALIATHPATFRFWFAPAFVAHFESQAALNLAVIYVQGGRPDEALAEYARLYEDAPAFEPAFAQYVFLLRQTGRTAEARRVCADAQQRGLLGPDALGICGSVSDEAS